MYLWSSAVHNKIVSYLLACLLAVVRRCRRRRCAFRSEDDYVPACGCEDRERMHRPCHRLHTEDRCWLWLLSGACAAAGHLQLQSDRARSDCCARVCSVTTAILNATHKQTHLLNYSLLSSQLCSRQRAILYKSTFTLPYLTIIGLLHIYKLIFCVNFCAFW